MIAFILFCLKFLGELAVAHAPTLSEWAIRFFSRRKPVEKCACVPPPTTHFLVSPFLIDAKDWARRHRYDWVHCAHVHDETSLNRAHWKSQGAIRVHYLRGWDKLDEATKARLRYLVNRT